ncbi:MAG: DUF3806 domain-containing protein [Chloroflexi bacterium]|nr:DUF3806 domain-containing protein [Chloroflexota bacterium]
MHPVFLDLTPAEWRWLNDRLDFAVEVAAAYGVQVPAGRRLDPAQLDRAWSRWLADQRASGEDPNPYFNAFGIAFGSFMIDWLGLEWKIVQDEHGTELAVYGSVGEVLVFPANLVAKRWDQGVDTFFGDVAASLRDRIEQVRAGAYTPPTSDQQR